MATLALLRQRLEKRILELRDLPANWDYAGSPSISDVNYGEIEKEGILPLSELPKFLEVLKKQANVVTPFTESYGWALAFLLYVSAV